MVCCVLLGYRLVCGLLNFEGTGLAQVGRTAAWMLREFIYYYVGEQRLLVAETGSMEPLC